MNYFKILQLIKPLVQRGSLKSIDEVLIFLQRQGTKIDGILRKGVENMFKKIKARDPDFNKVVQKLPKDDAGIPFNPNTLKSTAEKRGVDTLFQGTKRVNIPAEKLNHKIIAEQAGIDIELIRGKDWLEILEILKGKADGGRVGFQTGGSLDRSTLNERGQAIYDSMKSARHTDQTIIDQLKSLGLYNIGPDQGIASIVNVQPNIIGGDGGGGGDGIINAYNINQNLGPTNITDYEAEAYGVGPTWRGTWARLQDVYSKIPTLSNIVGWGGDKFSDWRDERKEKRAAEAAAAQELLRIQAIQAEQNRAKAPTGGGQRADPFTGGGANVPSYSYTSSGREGYGYGLKKGGLATMFARRR